MSLYHHDCAYQRGQMSGHGLDFAQQPHPFKRYRNLEPVDMARPAWPSAAFFDLALSGEDQAPAPDAVPNAAQLSAILLMSAGITALSRVGSETHGLRAPASAGALYPAELYFIAQDIEGLDDGLFHFAPGAPGLHPLWQAPLAQRAANTLGRLPSRLSFFITAMYWRSVWKYRSRAYRYCLLDSGHLLANLELALAGHGMSPATAYSFIDSSAGALLGLAPQDEAALAVVQAGGGLPKSDDVDGLPPLDLATEPLSTQVGRESQVLAAHAVGELDQPRLGAAWPEGPQPGEAIPLATPDGGGPDLVEVIRTRRSRRNFVPQALEPGQCSRLLAAAFDRPSSLGVTVALKTREPEPGLYIYHPMHHCLTVRESKSQVAQRAAQACLDQMWVGQASMVVLIWARLEALTGLSGPRAYRSAMLEAGRFGQRLYLAATALDMGCCGVGAFYDDELAAAMALPAGASPLYLLAAGPVKGGLSMD